MDKQSLKATVVAVSLIAVSLTGVCANAGEQYGKENPRQAAVPADVKVLDPAVIKELRFSNSEVAVVFVVDKDGNIQAYTPNTADKATRRDFPLPAEKIEHMSTITMFQTSNPKTCWTMFGTLFCVNW